MLLHDMTETLVYCFKFFLFKFEDRFFFSFFSINRYKLSGALIPYQYPEIPGAILDSRFYKRFSCSQLEELFQKYQVQGIISLWREFKRWWC